MCDARAYDMYAHRQDTAAVGAVDEHALDLVAVGPPRGLRAAARPVVAAHVVRPIRPVRAQLVALVIRAVRRPEPRVLLRGRGRVARPLTRRRETTFVCIIGKEPRQYRN